MKKTLMWSAFALTILMAAQAASVTTHAASWVNITGNLANMPSECGNLTLVSAVPGSVDIITGVALQGLWSNSGGSTWSHLGSGQGSDTINNRISWVTYDPLQPTTFWESGIYGSAGGIFRTTDAGRTFRRLGSISHNDHVNVYFGDPNRQLLLAGGHEQAQTVYRSMDGGATWTNIGVTMPATKHTTHPIALGPQLYLVNSQGWSGTIGGIFRTSDGGGSWQLVSTTDAYEAPLVASDGAIYWSAAGTLLKSVDLGLTWTSVGSGLQNVHPIELPDGRLASLGGNSILVSADGGVTWSPIGPPLPYTAAGLSYSAQRQAFFIWRWDCGNVVLPDAIMQLDFPIGRALAAPTSLRVVSN